MVITIMANVVQRISLALKFLQTLIKKLKKTISHSYRATYVRVQYNPVIAYIHPWDSIIDAINGRLLYVKSI